MSLLHGVRMNCRLQDQMFCDNLSTAMPSKLRHDRELDRPPVFRWKLGELEALTLENDDVGMTAK
jgi:hypothetical protein